MAAMFPNNLSDCENASVGECLVYSFLKETARPDRDFFCWYRPEIQKNEPDFIIFCRGHGLIVLEVKDWAIDQIRGPIPSPLPFLFPANMKNGATHSGRQEGMCMR